MEYTIEGKASQTTSELLAAAGAEAAGLRAVWLRRSPEPAEVPAGILQIRSLTELPELLASL